MYSSQIDAENDLLSVHKSRESVNMKDEIEEVENKLAVADTEHRDATKRK